MDTFASLMFPTGVPDTGVGDGRVNRIADEPFDQQIRNAGVDVVTAMLQAGRDRLIELASDTPFGQAVIQQTAQAQIRQAAPMLILIVVVLLVAGALVGGFFRGRA